MERTQAYRTMAEDQVVAEFKNRRKTITRFAVVLGVVAAALVSAVSLGATARQASILALVITFVVSAIVNARVWRCPSCNGHLGKLYLGLQEPKHCQNCGIRLIAE